MYGEDPSAHIEVRLSIPAANYMAVAQQIMSQYGVVVEDAMNEIRKDLMFNEKFQEEVKYAVKERLHDAVQVAIKEAAKRVVWETFMDVKTDRNIKKVIEDSIMDALREQED